LTERDLICQTMIAFNMLVFYFHLISHCLFGALTGRIYLYAWIAVSTKFALPL